MDSATETIEGVARRSYGRLVAYLASRTGDIAAAEDALSESLFRALRDWPNLGVPANPEAWLIQTARNLQIDEGRRASSLLQKLPALHRHLEGSTATEFGPALPDDRLVLMLACADPAIDPAMRTPLMLQVGLGLNAARIASAFLVPTATMAQRLVRTKAKIRESGEPLQMPDGDALGERLEAVLQSIYAAYGQGWDDHSCGAALLTGLATEARWLAEVVVELAPDDPEARGLLALILFCEARREARRSPEGRFVALSDQNPASWRRADIETAERHLAEASRRRVLGRFQLEAAIQSAHTARLVSSRDNWAQITALYDALMYLAPSVGAAVGRAASLAESEGPNPALAALDELPQAVVKSYGPFWAVRADLLTRLGRNSEAAAAFSLAAGLTEDPELRRFLLERRDRI